MRTAIVVVVALIAAAAAWFLLRDRPIAPASLRPPASTAATATAPPAAPAQKQAQAPAPGNGTAPTVTPEVERQARKFIAGLTEQDPQPVPVEHADRFVTGSQVIQLVPEQAVHITTPAEIAADKNLAPDTPITVVREVEQIENLSPERVLANAGGNLDTRIRVMEGGKEKERTVREVLERASREPEKPIPVVVKSRYYEVTTPAEIAAGGDAKDAPIGVISAPYALEAATVAEIMRKDKNVGPDSVFYVRTVRDTDKQGIWGIIFDGLVDNFARGMAIRRGRDVNTYRVDIPRDADELLSDRSSSFLGKLIDEKTKQTYVYNYRNQRMGRNPDHILPGQQIVIISFQPQELIDIYAHFVAARG